MRNKIMLLFGQAKASPKRGLPVDLTSIARRRLTKSAETIQLYYLNNGVYTIDGWAAAGTIVVGRTAYAPILWSLWVSLASYWDSSFYFTSDALTSEIDMEGGSFEGADYSTPLKAVTELTKSLTNGQYVVDHRNGMIYGKKASTDSTLTAASYRISTLTTLEFANADVNSPSSSPSASPSSSLSSSPSSSLSPSTSLSSSPSRSLSSSLSSSPSSSLSPSTSPSTSPSSSESPSTSPSTSPSISLSSSVSSSPSSSRSTSPSSSLSPSSSPSVSPSPRP